MNQVGQSRPDYPTKLLPHQNALVETFFDPNCKRVLLLRSMVGMGKTTALVGIVRRLMLEDPMSRVLFLVPAALQNHIVQTLHHTGTASLLVDRYRLREMLDSMTAEELWPKGIVVVMSLDFARQPDIQNSLATIEWELVIADEVHSIKNARANVVRVVGEPAKRVILSTMPNVGRRDLFAENETTVVEWQRGQVVDYNGKPLYAVPRPFLREVLFTLSPSELSLHAMAESLDRLVGRTQAVRGKASILHRRIESSPAALEEALRYMRDTTILDEAHEEFEGYPNKLTAPIDHATATEAAELAANAIEQIEQIRDDSKLNAFRMLLSELSNVKTNSRRICVVTDYVATLYYLATEIEESGMRYQTMYSAMSNKDLHRTLTQLLNGDGILIATSTVMTEGIALNEVTDLVLYDIPDNKTALQRVLGRFDRFGRRTPLNVYSFTTSNRAKSHLPKSLALLRDALDSA